METARFHKIITPGNYGILCSVGSEKGVDYKVVNAGYRPYIEVSKSHTDLVKSCILDYFT